MANEPLALAVEPERPNEDDYRALCAALSASARGRAFLAEYARRHRAADTAMLLAALERLERLVQSHAAPPAPPPSDDGARQQLLDLLDGIRDMQAEIDAGGLTLQIAKLTSLIEVVRQTIEGIVVAPGDGGLAEWPATPERELERPAPASIVADEPVHTARVMPSEAPALPDMPVSADPEVLAQEDQADAISASAGFHGVAAETEASFAPAEPLPAAAKLAIGAAIEAAAAVPAAPEPVTVFKAGTIPPPPPFTGEDFSPAPVSPADPLAPIMALSEDERLALFS